jgi:hypothetical protein
VTGADVLGGLISLSVKEFFLSLILLVFGVGAMEY